jgi:hypothetical protein
MSRRNPLVADAVSMLTKHNLVPIIDDHGKHIKLRWLDQGRTRLLVVSRTPSDRHSQLSSRTILKRLLRNS